MKGNKTACSNYRGTSLSLTTYNNLSSILLSKLSPYAEEIIRDQWWGFRRNRLKTDHIFYIQQTTGEPGSSVVIATDYAMEGPGSNPGGDEIFCPSRPNLRPTKPPVKWVWGLARG